MSTSTKVNIKSLPVTTEVKNGDYLILETELGTKLLDFENFVITQFNTTFNGTLTGHTDDIATNLSKITSISGLLSSDDATINIGTSAVGVSALGVGTNAPSNKLHVVGSDETVAQFTASTSSCRLQFNNSGGNATFIGSTDTRLAFHPDSTERMSNRNGGNVGNELTSETST